MRYVYSVVRFVPEPVRGEAVNLAVLVGSDESSEWELRRVDSLKRARALDEHGVLPEVVANVERLSRAVDDYVAAIEEDRRPDSEVSESWLNALAAHSVNVVQFTPPVPLLADSLETAIAMAASEFLVPREDALEVAEAPSIRKHAALAAARQAFRAQGLRKGEHYAERVDVVAGDHGRESFDFVVYNGRAVQLIQAWSFRAALQEDLSRRIRAWAWAVQGLRKSGGSATAGGRNLGVNPDVRVSALYVPPVANSRQAIWEEATIAFRELYVTGIPFDRANEVAAEAVRLIAGTATT